MSFEHQSERRGIEVHTRLAGVMTEDLSYEAIVEFQAAVPLEGEFEFHAHLTDLTKFDSASREAWSKALGKVRKRCKKIVLYGARPLVRMSAAAVAMMLRLQMEFRDDDPHQLS